MEDEEAEETRNLGKVCVTFDDATDTGLHLDDMMAVSSIEAGSAAALSLRVDKRIHRGVGCDRGGSQRDRT